MHKSGATKLAPVERVATSATVASVINGPVQEIVVGDTLLMRRKRRMFRLPAAIWKRNVRSEAHRAAARLEFMGPDHHRIRNFVVAELPRAQKPLSPEVIGVGVSLGIERVREILDELEAQLTFLYRRDELNVDWAYPVTVEKTPHRVTFDNGERFFAA
jgi:hypothetical protein